MSGPLETDINALSPLAARAVQPRFISLEEAERRHPGFLRQLDQANSGVRARSSLLCLHHGLRGGRSPRYRHGDRV